MHVYTDTHTGTHTHTYTDTHTHAMGSISSYSMVVLETWHPGSKMAHQVKMAAGKLEDQRSAPETHTMEGESQILKLCSAPHPCSGGSWTTRAGVRAHAHTNTCTKLN